MKREQQKLNKSNKIKNFTKAKKKKTTEVAGSYL